MGVVRSRAERIAAARAMFVAGVPKREIARSLRTSARTVGRWVQPPNDPSPPRPSRQPEPAAVLLEAALAWVMRFDAEPNSVTWNATRAWTRGPDAWQRHLEGWGPRGTTAWRCWPQAHDVTKQFGSWNTFHKQLDHALRRRRNQDDAYRPRPVPPQVARFAALAAYARGVIGQPRDTSHGDAITPRFVISTTGLLDLRGDPIVEGVAIVGDPGTGRSSLLAGVVELDRVRYPPVVLVQRADKPLVAAGLPNSDLMDLEEAIQLGCGAIVRSDDPDVRLMAIAAAADASANLRRDVCIAIDDADDLMANLANLMVYRPLTAHMAIAWSPRDTQVDAFVWAGLPSRAITTINDPGVERFFRNGVEPDLFARLGLPRST